MDRLNADAKRAAAVGWLSQQNSQAKQSEEQEQAAAARMDAAIAKAAALADSLAPIFPVIASFVKDDSRFETWVDSWARQIIAHQLTDADLSKGLAGLAGVMQRAGNPPLSFPLFLQACRPDSHLTGSDHEARQPHPLLLTRDRTQDPGWCAARDAALAKLRAMGYCQKPKAQN